MPVAAPAGSGRLLEELRAGRALRFGEAHPSREEIEQALGPVTAAVRQSLARNGGLSDAGLDAALAALRHEFIEYRGFQVHVEVHEAGRERPTVLVHHGLGDHVRRMTPLAARLAADGHNVVMVDRPGHGVSEGRRGHCPLDWGFDLIDESLRLARERFTGPVVLLGDSLGGITLWYWLTREHVEEVEGVVCHCILNPGIDNDRTMIVKAPIVRAAARVVPFAPVPITQIADYEHVALDPETQRYFDDRLDPAFCFTATVASAASYLRFSPSRPWEEVEVPVLVLIGAEDRMTSARVNRLSFERAHPPGTTFLELPDAGHQLFLDDLEAGYSHLAAWLGQALGEAA